MDRGINREKIKNFMENTVYLRKKYGFSKSKMARILGISYKTLESIERGELPVRLSVKIIYRIEDFFHIPPAEQFERLSD